LLLIGGNELLAAVLARLPGVSPGGPGFTLTVNGAGFVSGSVVECHFIGQVTIMMTTTTTYPCHKSWNQDLANGILRQTGTALSGAYT
jgi:hypothetical protein